MFALLPVQTVGKNKRVSSFSEYVVSDNLVCCPHYKWMGQWMAKVLEIANNKS